MKIQGKSIAVALLIAGVCVCSAKPSMAQKVVSQKAGVNARQSPHERNTVLINKFLKTSDKKAAFESLGLIKNGLTEELAATKRQILTAQQSNDATAVDKARQYNNELISIYNSVIQKSENLDSFDKDAVDQTFSKYLELKP